ncbi:unnamed protein product, partial [marine sediment metagenome]
GMVGYDVLVHELAHAVITFSSGLYYYGESGALNESYADVMGAVADGNWTVGEGRIGGGGAFRSLAHPTSYGDPDYMTDYVWTSGDHGGVHTNSGIPNKAAYILAVGQSGNPNQVSVNGVGTSVMGSLYFGAMRNLPTYAKFIDARNLTVSLANSYYPNTSGIACDVRNAFFLVGLGEADIDCDGIEDGGDKESWTAFVDAHSGEVLFNYEGTPSGTGGYDLDLEDANGTNAQNTNCYWDTTDDDQIGNEVGLFEEGHSDPEAVALWNYAKAAYIFYHHLNIHSYDNNNGQFELYIHSSVPNNAGAQWIAGTNNCDLIQFDDGMVGYDVLVHELAHAVITFSSGLYYYGESGALNESYADVMGAVADGNWTVGEGRIGGGGAFRSLAHPTSYGDPDYMTDYVWTSG